jgi:Predicted signal transduction protein with a C-terminal ATPase domain
MKGKSIKDKVLRLLLIFSLIPVIIFCLFMSVYVAMNNVKQRKESIVSEMGHMSTAADNVLREGLQLGRRISEDEKLLELLCERSPTKEQRQQNELVLNGQLLEIVEPLNRHLEAYVISFEGEVYKSSSLTIQKRDFTKEPWFTDAQTAKAPEWSEVQTNSKVIKAIPSVYASIIFPLYEEQSKRWLGSVLIEVDLGDVFCYQEVINDDGELQIFSPDINFRIENERVKVYDKDGLRIINRTGVGENSDNERIGKVSKVLSYWKKGFLNEGIIKQGGELFFYDSIKVNDWIVLYQVREMYLYNILLDLGIGTLALLIFLVLVAVYASRTMAQNITKPILDLSTSVKQVQKGDLETIIEEVGDDEIGELSLQFNKMVVDIRGLMDNIKEAHERRRQYELMLLQVQVNPHFLYNTFDSLSWLIRMKQDADALKMVEALTIFFKTGLNNGRDLISLKQEIMNVDSYMTIQLMRYKSKLQYHVSLEREVEDFVIPKLLLQPLVENAVVHGVKGKVGGGVISISAYGQDNKVWLRVEDSGKGIAPQKLQKIQKDMRKIDATDIEHYGLANVYERMHLFFGEKFSMQIESIENERTTVLLTIVEEEDDVQIGDCGR